VTIRLTRQFGPGDRAAAPYADITFDIGAGVSSLEVRLAYDRSAGVIDLGCSGPAGFRGWSGGARSRVVITSTAATPGYLPGEPEPGTWSVVLGLHRVPADGLAVVVEIDVPAAGPPESEPDAPPAPQRRPRRVLPAEPGLTWLACDFHAHTVHSDGSLGRAELAALAVDAGLDVLAVTDHNTVSHHAGLDEIGARYGIGLLPGQELTTDRGHANAFGAVPWVDFRQPPDTWVSQVDHDGGLLSINHPLMEDFAWHHPLSTRPRLAEIWPWYWHDRTWTGPLAWWSAWGLDTVPISGSDFHFPAEGRGLGVPTTWVAAESTEPEAVLAALRSGRTAVSAGYDAPALLRVEDELVAIGADGCLLADAAGRRRLVRGDPARFAGEPGPHRLETPMGAVVSICA
jgi:hypothetical protein